MYLIFIKNLLFTFFIVSANAEIIPPNYGFSLSMLEQFLPGSSAEKIRNDKAIQSDIFEDNGNQKVIRAKFKQPRYVLDIYFQTKDDKITDTFIRLPQHFLHDLVLVDLRKKYNKHDRFVRKDLSALYVWLNRDGNKIIYHGSCSITCFPVFVEITSSDKTVTPMYEKLNMALPKW